MQTRYGMTQSQTAQAVGTLQQVGMTPAQTAAMLASVRGGAGSVKNGYYNTAAATQTAISAEKGFISWGGSTTGSGRAGVMASRFSATPVLQGTGLTGQEGMNSTFGLAMMANLDGVSMEKEYEIRARMTKTDAGTAKYIDRYSKNLLKQLSSAVGTDLTKVTKKEDLNQHALILMYGLQGLQVPVDGPQQAVAYTWNLIEQSKGRYDKDKTDPSAASRYGGAAGAAGDARGGRGGSSYGAGGGSSGVHRTAGDAASHSTSNVPPPSTSHTSNVPPPSTSHTGTGDSQPDYVTNAYKNYAASRDSSYQNGSSEASQTVEVLLGFKQPHLKNIVSASVSHQKNSTNGTTAPSSLPSRAAQH